MTKMLGSTTLVAAPQQFLVTEKRRTKAGGRIIRLRRWVMKRRAITTLVVAFCVFWGHGCSPSLRESDKSNACHQAALTSLSNKIETTVINLGYTQQTAGEFAEMVLGWTNGSKNPLIAALDRQLADAKQCRKEGRISLSWLAKIERDIAERLVAEIRWRIQTDEQLFDLTDVVRHHKTQCLGYTQVFHITANTIGLTIRPINVLELDKRGSLPAGVGHAACMVDLSDGRTITANVVPNGFISRSFVLMDAYEKAGNYLRLKDKTNYMGIFRKIQILDEAGLAAYVHSNRASEHNIAGRFEQAITDSTRAIQLYPTLAEAWNNRGIARRNTGQIEQAISDYTRALELNPDYPEAYNNRGAAYTQLKQTGRSIADYSKAIELNPVFAEAYNNRGNAYASNRQLTQAITDYSRAIKHNPNLSQAYGNRAVNYALLGKLEQAKKDLVTATRLSPSLAGYAMRISERFDLGLNMGQL
jgi:tetratricopeptide (TPR) repeat protein